MSKNFSSSKHVENYHKELGFSGSFCVAPFTTLLLEPDGQVGACRHKGSDFPVGHILQNNFEEIWNGEFIKNWRREFLEGKPQICKSEVQHRKCHLCPDYNLLLNKADITIEQKKKPKRLAFNFNGHCNLECQMCHVWKKPNALYDRINFWDKLDFWIEDLEEVELLSGEPFIQKDTYKLIDIISQKKPNALWTFTTNANWKLSDYIKEQLNKIKIKNMIVSLDSTNEETYKIIRKKGDFKKAITTLKELQKFEIDRIQSGRSGLDIRVNFLFQKSNWKELEAVYSFSVEHQVKIFRTFLYEPEEYSLLTLNDAERINILNYYFNTIPVEILLSSGRILWPLLESISALDRAYYLEKYKNLLQPKTA